MDALVIDDIQTGSPIHGEIWDQLRGGRVKLSFDVAPIACKTQKDQSLAFFDEMNR